ncbi:GNAT family N-acetyltransferase [Limibacter armeniacum]|uniref:GNAT family N-acetyltransferase n=1 Tax=Limibacter armeniacum TaxID=466084 RepID=UPI002FE5BC1D
MIFSPFPELVTERLLLRQLQSSDREVVFYLRSDPTVNQFVQRPTPKSLADADAFIERISNEVSKDRSIYWCISLKGTTEMIGSICLWNFSEDKKTAEVGYDLHPKYQKHGYMSEALKSILEYGFNILKLDCIEACTDYRNESSKQLLVKHHFSLNSNKHDNENANNLIFEISSERYFI